MALRIEHFPAQRGATRPELKLGFGGEQVVSPAAYRCIELDCRGRLTAELRLVAAYDAGDGGLKLGVAGVEVTCSKCLATQGTDPDEPGYSPDAVDLAYDFVTTLARHFNE